MSEHRSERDDENSGDDDFTLKSHSTIQTPSKEHPFLLIVLDGWGESADAEDNAVSLAHTPTMDDLKQGAPDRWMTIKAHGTAVGLPSNDDMGNSEVGHNALGSGQIIDQGAKLVDKAVKSGAVFEGDGWHYLQTSLDDGKALHFIGLLSDGGVHSRYDQLLACLKGAAERGAKMLRVHVLTDGRDVEDGTSRNYVSQLQEDLQAITKEHPQVDAKIASGGGRMEVTMDRYESDWDIVQRGWKAHVLGEAGHSYTDPIEAIKDLKGSGDDTVSDQWLPPFVIVTDEGEPVGAVQDGDAVVIFNFRADRVIELSRAFDEEDFDCFDRKRIPKCKFVGMMMYDGELHIPKHYLVGNPNITRTSGQYLAKAGIHTFACAESQKIGHVTFFWNGNRGAPFDKNLEKQKEIKSTTGIAFNKAPEMKAREVADAAVEAYNSGEFNYVRVNFANGDMVGHTGDLKAAIKACSVVDEAVTTMLDAVKQRGGSFLVTADHGNCETMWQKDKKGNALMDKDGRPRALSSHTLTPVPLAIGGPGLPKEVRFKSGSALPKDAGLTNVTATFMNLLGFEAPAHMRDTLLV